MIPRSFVVLLCFVAAAAGAWAGHQWFTQATELLSGGSVTLMVKLHRDAQELARWSFATSAALLAVSVPASALIAGRCRARANYGEPLLLNLLVAVLGTVAALLYYRDEMRSLGLKIGEFLALMRDSRTQIAFNPLTKSLLFGAALTWISGAARGLVSPAVGKRK